MVRRVAMEQAEQRLGRILHLLNKLTLHPCDVDNYASVLRVLALSDFDECYHLAAQSFVAESFADGFLTLNTNINGTHYLLEGLRQLSPKCKFYFAGSSEMFGKVQEVPQGETTAFHPRSPYGVSKAAGFYLTVNYRESHGMFCVGGILFNHESPRRGVEFVSRKITTQAAKIKLGLARELKLGNLDAVRDWGHAADYVRAMQLMLQRDEPADYVIATGRTFSVRDFCDAAFRELGLDYKKYVSVDPRLLRPADVDLLVGDASKALAELNWQPAYQFSELVREMVLHDYARLSGGLDHQLLSETDECSYLSATHPFSTQQPNGITCVDAKP